MVSVGIILKLRSHREDKMNNIYWDSVPIGRTYRKMMCRIGVWFLNQAGIEIKEWEEVND